MSCFLSEWQRPGAVSGVAAGATPASPMFLFLFFSLGRTDVGRLLIWAGRACKTHPCNLQVQTIQFAIRDKKEIFYFEDRQIRPIPQLGVAVGADQEAQSALVIELSEY